MQNNNDEKLSMYGIKTYEILDKTLIALPLDCQVLDAFLCVDRFYINVYQRLEVKQTTLIEFRILDINEIQSTNIYDSFSLINKIDLKVSQPPMNAVYVFMENLGKRKNELWGTYEKSYLFEYRKTINDFSILNFTLFDSTKYSTEQDLRKLTQIWRKELNDSKLITILDWILSDYEKEPDEDDKEPYITSYETDNLKIIREEGIEDKYFIYVKKFNNWVCVLKPYAPVDFEKTDFISFVPASGYINQIKELGLKLLETAEKEAVIYEEAEQKKEIEQEVTELTSDILFKLSC